MQNLYFELFPCACLRWPVPFKDGVVVLCGKRKVSGGVSNFLFGRGLAVPVCMPTKLLIAGVPRLTA